jgi:hydrogenase-4 component F
MLLLAILLIPSAAAGLAYLLPKRGLRLALLVLTSVVHLALVAVLWTTPDATALGGWLMPDPLGLIVLTLVSVLFLAASVYAVGLLREESPRGGRLFVSCLLGFLAATSLVSLSHHFALLWVGMESTTLAVAPLIFHRNDRRSLEAVWKYLVLSSVGIAFALLAVFLLATSQPALPGVRALVLDDILANGPSLEKSWLRAAYVFALAGFGTKMGLAPLHTWKPDTYGEAPSLVGALMSGALTSCAFLGLARFTEVAVAAGLTDFTRPLLIAFGLISLVIAAAFIIGQADVKRLLAYSSVEHMGLLVLGLGVGGIGVYGSVLHVLNNGIAKGMLFLVVGNLVLATGSSVAADMRGMLKQRPWSAALLFGGLFAVTGSPPFGLFVSEFSIVSGAIREDHWLVAAAMLALLAIIFVGIGGMLLKIIFGTATTTTSDDEKATGDSALLLVGPLCLAALVVMLGLYIPPPLQDSLARAAQLLGGVAP